MPPPKKADPPVIMTLTANSLRNTTFAVEDDSFYYEVVTRFWHPHLTKINRLDPDTREMVLQAELDREPGKEPRLRFNDDNGEWVAVSKWFQREHGRVGGVFTTRNNIKYRWSTPKRNHLQLARIDEEGNEGEPLVVRHPHHRHFMVGRMSKHAYMEMKPEVAESLLELIMSYLIVERIRRDSRPHIEVKMA